MLFKKIFALASLTFAGFTAAQGGPGGDVTIYQLTYPESIHCGWNCTIGGEWLSVPLDFFDIYGCGALVRLTYLDGPPPPPPPPTTVAPICDICTTCTDSEWEAPPVVFGELGQGTAPSLPVRWDI